MEEPGYPGYVAAARNSPFEKNKLELTAHKLCNHNLRSEPTGPQVPGPGDPSSLYSLPAHDHPGGGHHSLIIIEHGRILYEDVRAVIYHQLLYCPSGEVLEDKDDFTSLR